jgi:hypothetical protein
MDRLDAGVEALLLGGIDDFLRGALTLRLGDELGELRIFQRRRLRQRIERDDANPTLILTVRGVGYKCNPDALEE